MRAIGGGGGETRKSQGREAVTPSALPYDRFQRTKSMKGEGKPRSRVVTQSEGEGTELTAPDFAVAIVSPAFTSKTAIQRHRMVNTLLKDEFDNMGLHALSLRLKTPEEWEKEVDVASAKMSV
jgi:stress-induced morphogen